MLETTAAATGETASTYQQRLDISDAPTGILDGDDSLIVHHHNGVLEITIPLGNGPRGNGVSTSDTARARVRLVDERGRVLAIANLTDLNPAHTAAHATLDTDDDFDHTRDNPQ